VVHIVGIKNVVFGCFTCRVKCYPLSVGNSFNKQSQLGAENTRHGGIMDMLPIDITGVPSGVPGVVTSEVPVVSAQAVPVVSAQAVPVVPAQAVPVVSAQAAPVVSTQAVPVVPAQAAPVVSTQAVPVVPAQAVPVVSAQAVPVVPAQAVPVAPTDNFQDQEAMQSRSHAVNFVLVLGYFLDYFQPFFKFGRSLGLFPYPNSLSTLKVLTINKSFKFEHFRYIYPSHKYS
jgi:hypothetical protein